MSNEDPGIHSAVISARSCGQMIELLQTHHDLGNRQRTVAASEGYLQGLTTWLEASVGPEATFNILTRQIDAITAKSAREKHLQAQE